MKAAPATPLALAGLVITGAAGSLVPARAPNVNDPALPANRTLAVFAPSVSGENRTTAAQVPVLATMPVQVVDSTWKSAASVPVTDADVSAVPVELLVKVRVCDVELVSTAVFGNEANAGDTVAE